VELAVGHPTAIVDHRMQTGRADTDGLFDVASTVGFPSAPIRDTGELFDVDMDQLTADGLLVASGRFAHARIEATQLRNPVAFQHPATPSTGSSPNGRRSVRDPTDG